MPLGQKISEIISRNDKAVEEAQWNNSSKDARIKVEIAQETEYCKEVLKEIIDNFSESPHDMIIALKEFLKNRWNIIKGTDLSYCSFSEHPTNKICIEIAELIAAKNEAIVSVLMPTITQENYDVLAESLQDLTETPPNVTPRRLQDLGMFLVSEDGKALIPILECFKYAQDTREFFHMFGNKTPLSKAELEWLKYSNGVTTLDYYNLIQEKRNLIANKGTFIGALRALENGLRAGGKSRGGSEGVAGDAADKAIVNFYRHYWSKLDKATTDEIGNLQINDLKFSSILLMLFSPQQAVIPLTDDEKERATRQKISTCVEITADALADFINIHTEKLSSIHEQVAVLTHQHYQSYSHIASL